jgi:hypothetical protein
MSYIITLWNALKGKPIWIRGPVVPVNDVVADQNVFGWCFNVETHMVVDFILRPCFIIINDIKIKVHLKAAERMKENDFKVCFVPSRRQTLLPQDTLKLVLQKQLLRLLLLIL